MDASGAEHLVSYAYSIYDYGISAIEHPSDPQMLM